MNRFRLIFELEPPRGPDLERVSKQIDIFGPLVDAILVPDNHLGLPAMSSVAIAVEIKRRGFSPIVALNARDRNHLRFVSDLVTIKAYGIEDVLFLYGDQIKEGRTDLNVKKMLQVVEGEGLNRGVRAVVGKPLAWRRDADFVVTDLGFNRDSISGWRQELGFSQPIYSGVLALSDAPMARKVLGNLTGFVNVPDGFIERFNEDPEAGFNAAISELDQLHDSGIDGAQLVVPAGRRRFAEMLAQWRSSKGLA